MALTHACVDISENPKVDNSKKNIHILKESSKTISQRNEAKRISYEKTSVLHIG